MKVFLAGEHALAKDASWEGTIDGWQHGALTKRIKRRLYSYYYHGFKQNNQLDKEVSLARDAGIELFLDSGAYSAFTQGETIKLEQYADFINKHGHIFTVRANLDDIGDTGPKSWANLKELEALGCKVFPVFHQNDDEVYLKKMLDGGYEFMALGGLVGSSRAVLQTWLDRMWDEFLTIKPHGTPRLKVHGFGLTDQALIQRYPWYSVDSSAWLFTGMMGGCLFRRGDKFTKVIFSTDPGNKDMKNYDGWHYKQLPEMMQQEVDDWLKPFGVTPEQAGSHYSFRHLINATTYQEMEELSAETFVNKQPSVFDES